MPFDERLELYPFIVGCSFYKVGNLFGPHAVVGDPLELLLQELSSVDSSWKHLDLAVVQEGFPVPASQPPFVTRVVVQSHTALTVNKQVRTLHIMPIAHEKNSALFRTMVSTILNKVNLKNFRSAQTCSRSRPIGRHRYRHIRSHH